MLAALKFAYIPIVEDRSSEVLDVRLGGGELAVFQLDFQTLDRGDDKQRGDYAVKIPLCIKKHWSILHSKSTFKSIFQLYTVYHADPAPVTHCFQTLTIKIQEHQT